MKLQMPSNLIIFDADYISELTNAMKEACELVDEAVSSLKKASLHEGWKCKECTRISENLDDLNLRLEKLDQGVNETMRVLGGSISRFAELESKYEAQANNLSDELRENYGYSASVHESSIGQGVSAGTAATAAAAGAKTETPISEPARHGNGATIPPINMSRMKIPSSGGNVNINNEFNNVNLPVTHIPDRPDDAATGIKDTEEISDFAVASVADTITHVLGGNLSVKIIAPDGTDKTVEHLVEAYKAGKSIVENSASIISNTSLPHTEERIAMATGIVSLAGSAVTGLGMLKGAGSSVGTSTSIQDLGKQAEDLIPSIRDDELKSVLGAISAAGSASSGAKKKSSFWDEIMEGNETINSFVKNFIDIKDGSSGSGSLGMSSNASNLGNSVSLSGLNSNSAIKTSSSGTSGQNFLSKLMESLLAKFTGGSSNSSSSSSSSPIQAFLSSFVADLG